MKFLLIEKLNKFPKHFEKLIENSLNTKGYEKDVIIFQNKDYAIFKRIENNKISRSPYEPSTNNKTLSIFVYYFFNIDRYEEFMKSEIIEEAYKLNHAFYVKKPTMRWFKEFEGCSTIKMLYFSLFDYSLITDIKYCNDIENDIIDKLLKEMYYFDVNFKDCLFDNRFKNINK